MTQFTAPSSYAIRLKVARVCYIIGSLYFMALDKLILFMAARGEDLLRCRSSHYPQYNHRPTQPAPHTIGIKTTNNLIAGWGRSRDHWWSRPPASPRCTSTSLHSHADRTLPFASNHSAPSRTIFAGLEILNNLHACSGARAAHYNSRDN